MAEIISGTVKVIVDACFKAGYDKGYQQGRADAIDEFMKIFEQKSADIFNDWCKDKRNYPNPTLASGVALARGVAEQLKEQKNE